MEEGGADSGCSCVAACYAFAFSVSEGGGWEGGRYTWRIVSELASSSVRPCAMNEPSISGCGFALGE